MWTGESFLLTEEEVKQLMHICCQFWRTSIVTDEVVEFLKEIVGDNSEYYLDETTFELGRQMSTYISLSTVQTILLAKLDYSLHVYNEISTQRDGLERLHFR